MRQGSSSLLAFSVVCVAGLLTAGPSRGAGDWRKDWATLQNERHGFLIAYPVEVFQQKAAPTTDEGRILFSPDGKAQLLVGAFTNDEGMTLRDYRAYLLQESYPGAVLDYAPVQGNWFVLSGTLANREFYERVSFTCGGRLINSWAMVYPVEPQAQNRFYDRVVEAIARTYTPGAGRSGNCD
jgi:hypothetical protein